LYEEGHSDAFARYAVSRSSNFCSSRTQGTPARFQFIVIRKVFDIKGRGYSCDAPATSIASPFSKSSSAARPAICAAWYERKPPSRSLTPKGLRLRRISQDQASRSVPSRETTT
jgi:hypothetical protein